MLTLLDVKIFMMLNIGEIKQLKIWKFLGETIQHALLSRFSDSTEDKQILISSSLKEMDDVYAEVVTNGNENIFAEIVNRAIIGLMDELLHEVKKIKAEYWTKKEINEHNSEVLTMEKMISKIQ